MPEPALKLRLGMVGAGMIFSDTYRWVLERLHQQNGLQTPVGIVQMPLEALVSATGKRASEYKTSAVGKIGDFLNLYGANALKEMMPLVDAVMVATPDHLHFEPCRLAIQAGKHVLVEKPSVLTMPELDELQLLASENQVVAQVVYHKNFDPDHLLLRRLFLEGKLGRVRYGYMELKEPRTVAEAFGSWITGRNPATYVAVHWIKLVDWLFGLRLSAVQAVGQRDQLTSDPATGTYDSVQTRLTYLDGNTPVVFDIHTSWVSPENAPWYVDQRTRFNFTAGAWNGDSRNRGVEVVSEIDPNLRLHQNSHYAKPVIPPWETEQLECEGYGTRTVRHFLEQLAAVEFGGPPTERHLRLQEIQNNRYSSITAERQVVAAVSGIESLLHLQAELENNGKQPLGGTVLVNQGGLGLTLVHPTLSAPQVIYEPLV